MPLRKSPKAARARKPYPKRKSVRSTVLQRAKTMEYSADPVPPLISASRATKEQKFLDMAIVSLDCNQHPGPADILLLNQIGQGTSVNTRVGMRYQMTGVHLRGVFEQQGPQQTAPPMCGYYLVYDSEPHGTAPTAQEMFNLRYNEMPFAFPNGSEGQKGGRFKYLARKQFLLGNQGSGSSPVPMDGVTPGQILINDYIPLNKLQTQCMRLNTGSTVSSIQKGALVLVPFGRNGSVVTGTAEPAHMSISWRLYFGE
ncbi:MAG: capsid protein [Circular genetic element sp.]|nr:MAG: capsid protein [Circular genetic element sp.]